MLKVEVLNADKGSAESFAKTAIRLIAAETLQGRPSIGAFSGRRLLLGGHLVAGEEQGIA